MKPKMSRTVVNKWNIDGSNGTIYSFKNEENTVLCFFSYDPDFKKNQELSVEEVSNKKPYKIKLFEDWDDLPNDCSMSFFL